MSRPTITNPPGRAKLALTLIVVCGVGGVGYAVAQNIRSPSSPDGHPRAAKSPFSRTLSIRVTPAKQSIAHGERARYLVQVRNHRGGRVTLSVIGGLPDGAIAYLDRTRLRTRKHKKSRSTLTVDTAGAPSGGYRLRLQARSGRRRAIASVNLVVRAKQPTDFSISGDLPMALQPGLTAPLDLVLTNPGPVSIAITGLEVDISNIEAPRASEAYPCTAEDFSVAQFSGAYGFTLGASTSNRLSQLGLPPESWPQVTMVDRPVNQNGCKAAVLHFSYRGTSAGGDE